MVTHTRSEVQLRKLVNEATNCFRLLLLLAEIFLLSQILFTGVSYYELPTPPPFLTLPNYEGWSFITTSAYSMAE